MKYLEDLIKILIRGKNMPDPDDIIQFAECYKPLKKALNPKTNLDLNVMFMFGVTRKILFYDRDDLNYNIFFNKNNFLAIIIFKKNWRSV